MICLDELGPERVKSVPGRRLVPPATVAAPRPRATQELDDGRRGRGYVFGAFVPATGAVLTMPAPRRTTAAFLAVLEQVEAWLDPSITRVYAILDNLKAQRASDVLLWAVVHPRWEFVFQPKYAASLNVREPWWKILRSLACKGRRLETWAEVGDAVAAATQYGNAHRHPFIWGSRQRRRAARPSGIASLPTAA